MHAMPPTTFPKSVRSWAASGLDDFDLYRTDFVFRDLGNRING